MTSPNPVPLRRVTAQQVALEQLRDLISQGHLKPDDWIRQEQIADGLGSSVVPVREALKTLEAEGLVRYIPHRGYQVIRLSLDELTETYLIRRLLEDETVRIAAPLLGEDDFAGLEAAMDTMESVGSDDTTAMIRANRDFHFTIFAASRHPRMVDLIRMLWQTTDAYRSVYYADTAARDRVNAEHRAILKSLRSGQVELAIQQLGQHRSHAIAALAERLE